MFQGLRTAIYEVGGYEPGLQPEEAPGGGIIENAHFKLP
jgi:hypothetical protein